MSNKKLEVIEDVKEAVQELVEVPQREEMTVFGKVDRVILDSRKARAEKKAARAEAKAEKKAKKEEASDGKKSNLKVIIPAVVVGAGAAITAIACANKANRSVELNDGEISVEDAYPTEETPAAEETSAVDQ